MQINNTFVEIVVLDCISEALIHTGIHMYTLSGICLHVYEEERSKLLVFWKHAFLDSALRGDRFHCHVIFINNDDTVMKWNERTKNKPVFDQQMQE